MRILIIDAGCLQGYSLGSRPEAEFFTPKKDPRVGPSKIKTPAGADDLNGLPTLAVHRRDATLVEIVGGEIRSEHVSRDGGLSTRSARVG